MFVGDYGQSRYRFSTTEPKIDQRSRTTIYEVMEGGHRAVIEIEGRTCHDTMSDETFESAVTVTLNGKEYSGCGRALH